MSKPNPSHPGESVRDSVEAMNWTVTEFSDRLGIPQDEVSGMLNGLCGISPATAQALERIGWSNAEFWMRRQAHYDLAQERRKHAIDPILNLGRDSISYLDIEDASVNHDLYIYNVGSYKVTPRFHKPTST